MSAQNDYNNHHGQYVLYYCNYINGDTTLYDIGLSTICVPMWNNDYTEIVLTDWQIIAYEQPDNETLIGYSLSTVLDWYNFFYLIPDAINLTQPYHISTSDLAKVRSDSSMIGTVVYDTTVQQVKKFNGSAWFIPQFVPLNGSVAMTGNLDLGTHNINNAVTIFQSTPSTLCIWSSNNISTSFSTNTPRLISINGFSQSINPNNDFSFDSNTGICTYIGSSIRYFRISIQYSYLALDIATTMTNFVSKNGSTSISGLRRVVSFSSTSPTNIMSDHITDIIQLSNNDSIQFGGMLTTTNDISYQAVSYAIEAL